MGRLALRLLALSILLLGGLAAAALHGAVGAGPATTSTSTTTPTLTLTTITAKGALVLTGHGWGHGMGMSQWGAYGYAKHGWTFDKILAHYYVGTTLGSAPIASVRVLVAQGTKETLASTVAWTVADSAGHTLQLDASTPVAVTPTLDVDGTTLTAPLTFSAASPLSVNGKAYRGRLVVAVTGKTLQVIDQVALESYVKGVVPSEMPSNWPSAALEAQAVAARSYALANLAKDSPFDLFGDGRSQVYGGVAAETPASNAAVDATKGQVVLYAGKVADTVYFSSSGGRTVSALEATGVAVRYLQSVSDPYDTYSPHHNWGPVVVDLSKVAKSLKVSSPIDDVQVTLGASGRVHTVTLITDDGSDPTFTGSRLRTALNLQSTWFTPGLLVLQPPKTAVPYGSATSLTGELRGAVSNVSLEERTIGGAWQQADPVVPGTDGAFSADVTPQVTMQYRLAWDNVRVGLARVNVAPALVVQAPTAEGLTGTVQPILGDTTVELQQEDGSVWGTVASTVTDGSGNWSFTGALAPGAYRVRCAPGHGLVAGVSSPVQVS
ncbi:MAG TPA: SpoIID/LytB domain-containing protein [Gaiellaceae bacterium]